MLEGTIKENLEKYPNILIGKIGCPFCESAAQLLIQKKKYFLYVPKENHINLVEDVKKNYKHSTFPAIFLNHEFVGGCDSLKANIDNPKYFSE